MAYDGTCDSERPWCATVQTSSAPGSARLLERGPLTFDASDVDAIFDPTLRDDLYLAMASEPLDGGSGTEWVNDVWVNLPSVGICRGPGGGGVTTHSRATMASSGTAMNRTARAAPSRSSRPRRAATSSTSTSVTRSRRLTRSPTFPGRRSSGRRRPAGRRQKLVESAAQQGFSRRSICARGCGRRVGPFELSVGPVGAGRRALLGLQVDGT